MSSPTELAQLDNLLYQVALKLSSIPYLPTNCAEEREKFFSSNTYNPVFRYNVPYKESLSKIRHHLSFLKFPDSPLGMLFQDKRDELLKIIDMMNSIGTHKLTEISKSLYGVPSPSLVLKAREIIHFQDAPESLYLSTQQVIAWLMHTLSKYNFEWEVQEREMPSRACINLHEKVLYIKKDCFFTYKFLNRLIVHEIGTHILRYECGMQQPYKLFSLGLGNCLGTEEGLALVNEEMHNCLIKDSLKTYAAWVLAVSKAMKCTFRETYSYLVQFVGSENAYDIAMKVKSGLGNTALSGAFTKDYLCLQGYFDVKGFIARGGNIQRLYYGKVGIMDLECIENVEGLTNPLFFQKMKYYVDYINYRKDRFAVSNE